MAWSGSNNIRGLDLSPNDASYNLLETSLKNVEIIVETPGRRPRTRNIRSLVPRAGHVLFEKNGIQTTVQVQPLLFVNILLVLKIS
jgi:hypothetical protein